LVLSIDALVSNQAGSLRKVSSSARLNAYSVAYRDHIGSHSITNKEDNVLRLANILDVTDSPGCGGLVTVIVGKGGSVFWKISSAMKFFVRAQI
jgi:hypothetical protein